MKTVCCRMFKSLRNKHKNIIKKLMKTNVSRELGKKVLSTKSNNIIRL